MIFIKKGKAKALLTAALALTLICGASATASAAGGKMLVPMGGTVGIQVFTNGVLIVGLSSTENGSAPSPAAEAGLLPGDLITAMGAAKITCAEDFRKVIETLGKEAIVVTALRGDEELQFTIKPNCTSGAPELGLWLRDRISGIGTMTYYDPQTGVYGSLGHGINDMDTGLIIPLGRGDIFRSTVSDVKKGCPGTPGELCGVLDPNSICGSIVKNTDSGIFGILNAGVPDASKAIPAATDDEIQLGKATIFANVCNTEVKEYEIEITRVYRGDDTGRSLMLKVTDPELLKLTGGIVQGMSGGPIIQNGKLIGAVTHVLINDPEKGFGVSMEKMLKASKDCEKEQKTQNAA